MCPQIQRRGGPRGNNTLPKETAPKREVILRPATRNSEHDLHYLVLKIELPKIYRHGHIVEYCMYVRRLEREEMIDSAATKAFGRQVLAKIHHTPSQSPSFLRSRLLSLLDRGNIPRTSCYTCR